MTTATIKNWAEFQHYKDRSPPWLKLHRTLLDNYEYQSLPLASKALAPMLWLIASEAEGGVVRIDIEFLAFRLRWPEGQIVEGLKPLIDKGFVVCDSSVLAECLQDACLETEGETEKEGEKDPPRKRVAAPSVELKTYIEDCERAGRDPIPADDAVYAYADKIGLPDGYVALAWSWFKTRMAGKRQKDWRAHFRNAVENNWPKYWYAQDTGGWALTTAGKQAQAAQGGAA